MTAVVPVAGVTAVGGSRLNSMDSYHSCASPSSPSPSTSMRSSCFSSSSEMETEEDSSSTSLPSSSSIAPPLPLGEGDPPPSTGYYGGRERRGRCVVVEMTDEELEYVERAHEESQLIEIYGDVAHRFVAPPPYVFYPAEVRLPWTLPNRLRRSMLVKDRKMRKWLMEQSEEGARMAVNGGSGGARKEETVSRSPFHSAAHPTVWSTAASVASGGVAESAGSLPPRAPPSGFVDEGGRFTISEMDYLSEEIWHYHNTMTQTESTLSRKLHLRDMLYYAICPVFPMCGLYVVGSSLNGFGNNSSDMDLCLMITNKDLDQKTDAVVVLNMILNQLENVEWVAHQQLILAKVPILRIQFTAPFGDITVDLNANNSVAIKNTHLLCYYSTFDWRVRPLVTIVKEWAKKKGINDANRSSFTSYSLVLMVIHYLQCGLDQPVLPSLQSMYARRFSRTADVRSLNVSIPLAHPPEEWSFNDTSSLGELLIGFLEYFALKFDYNQHAISVRMGKKLDRTVVVRMRGQGFNPQTNNWRSQWRCVCIEEPFTYSNTAHSVYDEMVFTKIKEAFKDAYHQLESTRDLSKLMECLPISVPNLPHGNGAVVYMGGSHADTSVVASSSSSSLSTPHSGHASSASSSCGDDEVGGVEKSEVLTLSSPSPSPSPRPVKKDLHPTSHLKPNHRSSRPECTPVVSINL